MKYKIIINKDIKEKGGSPPFSTINSSENYNHSLMCSFVEYIIVFLLSTQNLCRISKPAPPQRGRGIAQAVGRGACNDSSNHKDRGSCTKLSGFVQLPL